MKEFDHIPVSKIQRAGKFIQTGARIGGNYLRHYGKKILQPDMGKEQLHEENAADIYHSLSELKGSALKVAQMLSMDKGLLPKAYQQKFTLAQYSAPPLSYPLVARIFKKSFGKGPEQIFDTFSHQAINAASMGQVHQAVLGNWKLAVKVQYPGIADSIKSDLAMVRPIALRMFSINPVDYNEFIREVEERLMEEADYRLELRRSMDLSRKCAHIPNIVFPKYYPEYSSERILTMDWMEGKPLGELFGGKLTAAQASVLGQAMWDFYDHQMHELRQVHADPHPGNFLMAPDGRLVVIDFGCVKTLPDEFHGNFFRLLDRSLLNRPDDLEQAFLDMRFLHPDDTTTERKFFFRLFAEMVELLSRPFDGETFDFSDEEYFKTLYAYGERLTGMKELRESKQVRGVRVALYINRTYYGLYSILHELKVTVRTRRK